MNDLNPSGQGLPARGGIVIACFELVVTTGNESLQ